MRRHEKMNKLVPGEVQSRSLNVLIIFGRNCGVKMDFSKVISWNYFQMIMNRTLLLLNRPKIPLPDMMAWLGLHAF